MTLDAQLFKGINKKFTEKLHKNSVPSENGAESTSLNSAVHW